MTPLCILVCRKLRKRVECVVKFRTFLTSTICGNGQLHSLVSLPIERALVLTVYRTGWHPEQLRMRWRRRESYPVQNQNLLLRLTLSHLSELFLITPVNLHQTQLNDAKSFVETTNSKFRRWRERILWLSG